MRIRFGIVEKFFQFPDGFGIQEVFDLLCSRVNMIRGQGGFPLQEDLPQAMSAHQRARPLLPAWCENQMIALQVSPAGAVHAPGEQPGGGGLFAALASQIGDRDGGELRTLATSPTSL